MFKLVAKYTFIRPVATDTLGHWDVYMACLPQISVCTMPKDDGMPS